MTGKRLGGVTRSVLIIALIFSFFPAVHAAKHKIRSGDTLWDLAKKHHTTPKALARANGIRESATLGLGKSIVIPGKGSTARRHSRHAVRRHSHPAMGRSASRSHKMNATVAKVQGEASGMSTDTTVAPQTRLIRTALACRGARYRRGGTSRGGFDCSGFTRYVFAKYGMHLPHSSAAQAHIGTPVPKGQLREGDLVFFRTYRRGISHVGIYVGNGRFVHASTHGRGVVVDPLNSAYYLPRYRGARRIR